MNRYFTQDRLTPREALIRFGVCLCCVVLTLGFALAGAVLLLWGLS